MIKQVNEIDRIVGRRIRLRRIEQRISQQTLAKGVGVTFQQIQKYENGMNRVSAGKLMDISKLLDVEISYFFGQKGEGHLASAEAYLLKDPALGLRLIKSFNAIEDENLKRSIVSLTESAARSSR